MTYWLVNMRNDWLVDCLRLNIGTVKHVGEYIKNEASRFKKEAIEHKGLNDLVSYVDKEAEQRLVTGLQKGTETALNIKPGFITEENTINKEEKDWQWIIDPLDGTTNFIHGLPVFAISVALMHQNQLKIGIVYEINRDECFYAIKGGGAYLNDERIKVSNATKLSDGLLATGFPYYDFDKMKDYLQILNAFMRQTHGLRRMGSAAVDLAYVACGRFEGFFEYNLNPWDVAAGALIVQEAGGQVSDFNGGDNFLFGREIVASANLHDQMLPVIQQFWQT